MNTKKAKLAAECGEAGWKPTIYPGKATWCFCFSFAKCTILVRTEQTSLSKSTTVILSVENVGNTQSYLENKISNKTYLS